MFFQQVYIYTTEWCKTIYSWSISIFAFDPRRTRFSRLAHWSLGRVRRFGWTHPELETSISLLLSSLIVDISLVSCSEAYILGLTFTGGLSTGTATYTGDWRPLTREVLLLVKRVVSLTFVLNFAKGGLILSIALGVCNKKKQRYFLNVRLTISKKNSRSCMLSTSLWTSSLNPLTPKNNRAFRTPRRRRPRKRRKRFRVLWNEIAITPTHSLWQMKGELSWRWISKNDIQVQKEKGPGRKILAQGRPLKADHPRVICFLYSVYMQWVLLVPSARIFLAERS